MKTKSVFLMISLMVTISGVRAQKALPVQMIKFLSGSTMPNNSSDAYHMCTTQTDENGIISVKDAGKIDKLTAELQEDMKELGMAMMNSVSTTPSMPSQEQMAQMQQNAMNMQGMTPEQAMKMAQNMSHQQAMPQANNVDLMDEFGKAQTTAEELTMTINELTTRANQLTVDAQTKIDEVKSTHTCLETEVKGTDLALPSCGCVKEADLEVCNGRIAIENDYLQKLSDLLQSYMPKIRENVSSIDKVEADLKYGDAISIPAFKTQVVGLQQQAMLGTETVLGFFSQTVQKAGQEYAGVVNINAGHLSQACQ